jgi:hypothetical protein
VHASWLNQEILFSIVQRKALTPKHHLAHREPPSLDRRRRPAPSREGQNQPGRLDITPEKSGEGGVHGQTSRGSMRGPPETAQPAPAPLSLGRRWQVRDRALLTASHGD